MTPDPVSASGRPPMVAVVSPCYEQVAYVELMGRSVLGQTLTDWQLVVVDDGSSDGGGPAARAAAGGDSRVSVVRIEHSGVARARNAGLACTDPTSPYVLFLDADDELEPDALSAMAGHLERHPSVGLVHCLPRFVDAQGRDIPQPPGFFPRVVPRGPLVRVLSPEELQTPFVSILCLAAIMPSLALIRRSVLDRAGAFDEQFGQGYEDTDLFLRLALQAQVHQLSLPLVRHRRHPGQHTVEPSRNDGQLHALRARWRDPGNGPPGSAPTIRAAWRFADRQMTVLGATRAARGRLRAGHPLQALRFLAGGTRVALRSLIFDR